MTVEEAINSIDSGVTIAAEVAQVAAPFIAIANPAIGAAMALLTPIATNFIIKGGDLVVQFRKDMTPQELIQALNASKSANWPVPPPIV